MLCNTGCSSLSFPVYTIRRTIMPPTGKTEPVIFIIGPKIAGANPAVAIFPMVNSQTRCKARILHTYFQCDGPAIPFRKFQ